RHDAERDLGLAEHGGVGGEDDVASHGKLAAAAERIACDRSDDRLAAVRDAVERREEVAAIGLDEGLFVHLLDVDAGGERLLVAGDDDAADAGIRLEAVERAVDLADQLGVEGVHGFWPVESDHSDLAFGRGDDRLVGAVAFGATGSGSAMVKTFKNMMIPVP